MITHDHPRPEALSVEDVPHYKVKTLLEEVCVVSEPHEGRHRSINFQCGARNGRKLVFQHSICPFTVFRSTFALPLWFPPRRLFSSSCLISFTNFRGLAFVSLSVQCRSSALVLCTMVLYITLRCICEVHNDASVTSLRIVNIVVFTTALRVWYMRKIPAFIHEGHVQGSSYASGAIAYIAYTAYIYSCQHESAHNNYFGQHQCE